MEAISPTPQEELKATKDELLQQITKVDCEIEKAEKTILNMKRKQEDLEKAKGSGAEKEAEPAKHQAHGSNLAQLIYAENRKRAHEAHSVLSALNAISCELPLYNQPQDAETCRDNQQRHLSFKARLLLHFRKVKTERAQKQNELSEKYAVLSQEWLKRVDKMEAKAARKAKEVKNREFFEKIFPELRKQREDKERFNRVGSRIKSEADYEEIMDGLQEQVRKHFNFFYCYFILR